MFVDDDEALAKEASVAFYKGTRCCVCGCCVVRVNRPLLGVNQAGRGIKADKWDCCSRECGFQKKRLAGKARLIGRLVGRIVSLAVSNVNLAVYANCLSCGSRFKKIRPDHACCSNACSVEIGRRRSRSRYESRTGTRLIPLGAQRACKHCGRVVDDEASTGRGRSSCDECNILSGQFKDRARKYGVRYVHFKKTAVFERDGWACQLCGKPVLRRAKRCRLTRRLHPRTASLDHIVPLSKGGDHCMQNTQCACLECNVRKGARAAGQLWLFATEREKL